VLGVMKIPQKMEVAPGADRNPSNGGSCSRKHQVSELKAQAGKETNLVLSSFRKTWPGIT